jgi:hypothetical protein
MNANPMARKLGIDRNPLRRPTDRIEARLTLALIMLLAVLGPLLVWWVSVVAYRATAADAARDARHQRFEVTASLLDDPAKHVIANGDGQATQGPVPAHWTAPDGTEQVGSVIPPPNAHVGDTVVISTDVHGKIAEALTPRSPMLSAVVAGFSVGLGLFGVAALLLLIIRLSLNRRRMADWQLGWLRVERQWSGRR